jgi:hypothetical protein
LPTIGVGAAYDRLAGAIHRPGRSPRTESVSTSRSALWPSPDARGLQHVACSPHRNVPPRRVGGGRLTRTIDPANSLALIEVCEAILARIASLARMLSGTRRCAVAVALAGFKRVWGGDRSQRRCQNGQRRNRNGERAGSAHRGAAYRLVSTRIVVLNPNIAVEDIPRRQALLAGALPSPGQRFKPSLGTAGNQINEVILAGLQRR